MYVMVLADLTAEDGKTCEASDIEREDISELAVGKFSLHRSHLPKQDAKRFN
jgi:hypothetical protein